MSKIFKIAKIVDEYTIVLNAGSNQGIKENQRFLIYSLDGEEVFDPDTKELLGKLEVNKGTGTVTFLQEKMCTVKSDLYSNSIAIQFFGDSGPSKKRVPFKDPHVGDLVKPV